MGDFLDHQLSILSRSSGTYQALIRTLGNFSMALVIAPVSWRWMNRPRSSHRPPRGNIIIVVFAVVEMGLRSLVSSSYFSFASHGHVARGEGGYSEGSPWDRMARHGVHNDFPEQTCRLISDHRGKSNSRGSARGASKGRGLCLDQSMDGTRLRLRSTNVTPAAPRACCQPGPAAVVANQAPLISSQSTKSPLLSSSLYCSGVRRERPRTCTLLRKQRCQARR